METRYTYDAKRSKMLFPRKNKEKLPDLVVERSMFLAKNFFLVQVRKILLHNCFSIINISFDTD